MQEFNQPMRQSVSGFSLIEIMTVVVIIGLLAAVGYPSYTGYVRNSKRADAHDVLNDIASRQERYFSDNNSYTSDLDGDLGLSADPAPSPEGFWQVTATAGSGNFSLEANPAGSHVDPTCNDIIFTSLGQKRSRTTVMDDATYNDKGTCW